MEYGPVTFLLAWVLAIFGSIRLFDFVSEKPDDWLVFRKLPWVRDLKNAHELELWQRLAIFFSGFGVGYLILKFG